MTTGKPAAQAFTLHFPAIGPRHNEPCRGDDLSIRPPQRRAHHRRLRRPRHLRHLPGADRRGRDRRRRRASGCRRTKKSRWVRACQVTPKSDCTIEIAARSLAPVVRAEFDAGEAVEILPLDAAVVSRDISVPQATLADNLSDLDRVIRALALPPPAVDLVAARQLPAALARRRLVAARAYPRRRVDRVFAARPARPSASPSTSAPPMSPVSWSI